MVKVSDVLASAWMVRVLRRELRRDKKLVGTVRASAVQTVNAMDSLREIMATAVKMRLGKAARKKG